MAQDPRLTNLSASAAADAVVDRIDTGGAGKLRIYDGTIPTNADTALGAQVLLAELTFAATAFGAASNGVATAATITADSSADATGTAAWFRIINGAGTTILDGTVGTSSADLILNTVAIVTGANVSVSAMTYTQPLTQMSALSDYLEAGILNHIFRNTDIGNPPANVYIALFTTATTDAGGGTEVANLYSYARATVSTTAQFTAPGVGGSTSNVNEVAFTAASGGNWGTVTHCAITDSATYGAGNWYFHGPLAASQAVNDGDVFRFVAGALVITLA